MPNLVKLGATLALVFLLPLTSDLARAEYYDDGNDREDLNRLRNLRATGGALTVEERAILQAADRVGKVFWPDCIAPEVGQGVSGNAFLVTIDGRDAVLTAAHFIKQSGGGIVHGCSLEDFLHAEFLYNISYRGHEGPAKISDTVRRERTHASVDPRFGAFNADPVVTERDWIVLFLEDQISSLPAPGQTEPRGTFRFGTGLTAGIDVHTGYILGEDGLQSNLVTTWQKCEIYVPDPSLVLHNCDTAPGSSGSFFGSLEAGELVFRGINVRGLQKDGELRRKSAPKSEWNTAVSANIIQWEIKRVLGEPLTTPPAPLPPPDPQTEPAGIDL